MQTTNRIQKLITFSPRLYAQAAQRAQHYGLNVAEYIRTLLVADIKEAENNIISEEAEKQVESSLQALEKGEFVRVRTKDQLAHHLETLKQE